MRLFMKLNYISYTLFSLSLLFFLLILTIPCETESATFAVRISPPNFELKGKPGDVLREVITIENTDTAPGIYHIQIVDFELNEQGAVVPQPTDKPLSASSCRPWTRKERHTIKLPPKRIKRYRFEVHVPADAQDGECRFAVLISPSPETIGAMKFGSFNVPVAGAIAVVVYVTVGKAKPELEFKGVVKKKANGKTSLTVNLHNWGNAHARPSGNVIAKGADGKKAELLLSPFPIMPGETRGIRLFADKEISGIEDIEELAFPLYLKGLVEWDGGTYKVDTMIE
jgi:fimbrial chaperone protein